MTDRTHAFMCPTADGDCLPSCACWCHPPVADTLGDGNGVPVERLRALHEDWRIRSERHLAAVSDRPRIIELRRCMAAIDRLLAQPSATSERGGQDE